MVFARAPKAVFKLSSERREGRTPLPPLISFLASLLPSFLPSFTSASFDDNLVAAAVVAVVVGW